ncbi:aspartate/glutamate racemase family protein [Gordonia sinesedis]
MTTPTTTIALLYPGHAAEDDFEIIGTALRQVDDTIRLRVVITDIDSDAHTVAAMRSVGESDRLLAGARAAAEFDPAAVMWACTSGSFLYGWSGAATQVAELTSATGLPASSTSLAFAHACAALGIDAVAVAATYPEPVAAGFTEFLRAAGISVTRFAAHDIATASAAGDASSDELIAMVRGVAGPPAQAVLVPDTALHTAAGLTDLEHDCGTTVLTANQVTAWEGLRLCGVEVTVPSLGSLFDGDRRMRVPHAARAKSD